MIRIIESNIISNSENGKTQMIDRLEQIAKSLEICLDSAKNTTTFLIEQEKEIKKTLESKGIRVKDIYFSVDSGGIHEFEAIIEENQGIDVPRLLHSTLKNYLNKFILKTPAEEGEIHAHAKECSNFTIECAAMCKTKKYEKFCGDKAVGFSANKDLYYFLLADGMGSGNEAHTQSEITASSLHRLLAGGISPIDSLNIFRSTLRLRSMSSFSTIDICAVDLKNGALSFFKAGAYNSYLLKQDRCIEIPGGGLPIGLSDTDKVTRETLPFAAGDYLIMASDGISLYNGDIGLLLNECRHIDSKIFAKNILKTVCDPKHYSGEDDLSIIVCKFEQPFI